MSKKIVIPTIELKSLTDAGYVQARSADVTRELTKFVMSRVPSFPDELPDEAKSELVKGYQLRFAENNPDIEYALVDGNYFPVTDLANSAELKGNIKVGVAVAMSYTQQAYGALGNDKSDNYNPTLKTVIGVWRDKFSKYVSNRISDLKALAKKIRNESKPRERAATKEFDEFLKYTFDNLQSRCKVANARGDETANEKLFSEAKVAFLVKWNHAK